MRNWKSDDYGELARTADAEMKKSSTITGGIMASPQNGTSHTIRMGKTRTHPKKPAEPFPELKFQTR
jgi:hypothetical protein